MMTPTNGHDDDKGPRVQDGPGPDNNNNGVADNTMLAMEMESLHPGTTTVRRAQQPPHPCSQLWMLIKLHIEYYPKIFSTVGLLALAFLMYMAVEWSRPALQRHELEHDYSDIHMDYNFKATQMDHWCLFGGDNACSCEDFTEPSPRDFMAGWLSAHNANKERALSMEDFDVDVVFLGDDLVEAMNGLMYNKSMPDGDRIKAEFETAFSFDGGSDIQGLALGITGDSSTNLMWRIQHDEMPAGLYSKVWWISIGSNDMAKGGCSEEATTLGILQVAEEVAFNNPGSIVVIQGILPRSSRSDGSLESKATARPFSPFAGKKSEEFYAQQARKYQALWPSIQAVNKELEDFCKEHEHIVYFDASALFLGTTSNSKFTGKSQQIVTELMPDYVHLSVDGYKLLNQAIRDEVENIVMDEDETNDVEPNPNEPDDGGARKQ